MNSRHRRKMEAAEHQRQRELKAELHHLRYQCYKKYGRMIQTYGLTSEQAIEKYKAVLSGEQQMPKRNIMGPIGLASIMAACLGGEK